MIDLQSKVLVSNHISPSDIVPQQKETRIYSSEEPIKNLEERREERPLRTTSRESREGAPAHKLTPMSVLSQKLSTRQSARMSTTVNDTQSEEQNDSEFSDDEYLQELEEERTVLRLIQSLQSWLCKENRSS